MTGEALAPRTLVLVARHVDGREIVEVSDRSAWRRWLTERHEQREAIWLVFHKKTSDGTSPSYEEAVEEALCFGWIDSTAKRLDERRNLQLFAPRKPRSTWSASNKERVARLEREGLLAPAGIAAAPTGSPYAAKPKIPELPAYIARALKANPAAWRFFQQLAPTYRRHFVAWIHLAKRPETREKRIRESIALLAAGKKLGLK